MENFKEIAEKCLAGELSGTFVLRNNEKRHVSKKNQTIREDYLDPYSPYIIGNRKYSRCGSILPISNEENPYDIIDFIPDNMQEQIKIDIPEGKVPVMEQTENGVVITWKEKELTYTELMNKFRNNLDCIHVSFINSSSQAFHKKVEVLRKLTNIRNYFGKPKHNTYGHALYYTIERGIHTTPTLYPSNDQRIIFYTKEHAEQAIKMLGDELKYLFEPW